MIKKNTKTRRKLTDIRKTNLQQILQVAETLFAERGYRGTTVSAIAEKVNLPKANILYYFKTKEALYQEVLNQLTTTWMGQMNEMRADSHPRVALRNYIINKVQQSKQHPNTSRIFAAEILHGAEHLRGALEGELKQQFDDTCQVFESWMAKGWMDPVDPQHLIFMLWSSTQAYADHALQHSILMGKEALQEQDFELGIESLTQIILKGCGVLPSTC